MIFFKMYLSKTQNRSNFRITFKNWNGTLIRNRDYSEFFMKLKNSTKQNSPEKGVTRLG